MRTLLLLIALAVSCVAQGLTLSGTVRDAKGKPMSGVAVRLSTRSQGFRIVATNAEGIYTFSNLGNGVYPVSFEQLGYITVKRNLELAFDDDKGNVEERNVVMVHE